jgi:serine/threonine-protein kinase RsbW
MARHAVAALARLRLVEEDVVEDVKLAVSEACTTAVNENAEIGGEPVDLRVWGNEGRLEVEVLDRGTQLERAVSGPPDEISTADLPFERTLALPIIRGLVDEVAITPRPDGGASVRMVFSLGVQSR